MRVTVSFTFLLVIFLYDGFDLVLLSFMDFQEFFKIFIFMLRLRFLTSVFVNLRHVNITWYSHFSFVNAFSEWTADHMRDIVGLLFKYIILLQKSGVQKWIFDEVLVSWLLYI